MVMFAVSCFEFVRMYLLNIRGIKPLRVNSLEFRRKPFKFATGY